MFNVYTNEIPVLYKLINTDIYYKMGAQKIINLKKVSHEVINFVDDSTNIIGFRDHNKIKSYLETYFTLLKEYYNINKLKLNADKTKLLIVNKNKHN